MAIGSGLAASLNIKRETTFGVPVAADRSLEFVSESLNHEKNVTDTSSLRAGRQVKAASRRKISNVMASGDIELEFGTRGHGILLEALMGFTGSRPAPVAVAGKTGTPTVNSTTWVLGEMTDSYTIQTLLPKSAGTLTPVTFPGCKCTGAEFNIAVGELLKATFSWDGVQALMDDSTTPALAAQTVAYPASALGGFTFREGSVFVKAKGALDTTFAALGKIKEMSISVETPMDTERFFLGSAGLKDAQIQNDLRNITGSLTAEYFDNTLLNNYLGDVEFGLRLKFQSATALSGITPTTYDELTFTLPSVFLEGGTPQVGGPDVVEFGGDFTAYTADDGTSALTIVVQNQDTVV